MNSDWIKTISVLNMKFVLALVLVSMMVVATVAKPFSEMTEAELLAELSGKPASSSAFATLNSQESKDSVMSEGEEVPLLVMQ